MPEFKEENNTEAVVEKKKSSNLRGRWKPSQKKEKKCCVRSEMDEKQPCVIDIERAKAIHEEKKASEAPKKSLPKKEGNISPDFQSEKKFKDKKKDRSFRERSSGDRARKPFPHTKKTLMERFFCFLKNFFSETPKPKKRYHKRRYSSSKRRFANSNKK